MSFEAHESFLRNRKLARDRQANRWLAPPDLIYRIAFGIDPVSGLPTTSDDASRMASRLSLLPIDKPNTQNREGPESI
jgi:hypothetical protein